MPDPGRYDFDFDPERRFEPLGRNQCLEHLREGSIGRVAWVTDGRPQILPVTYVLRDEGLVFRTTPDGPLAALAAGRPAAFEADEYDARRRDAWSVCVSGRSGTTTLGTDPAGGTAEDPVPWAPGDRDLVIVISLDEVTGRRLTRR